MGGASSSLTEFQKEKLLHEFHTFFDLNGDGSVSEEDFQMCKQYLCKLNCWETGGEKEQMSGAVFGAIWQSLQHVADEDSDGRVSGDEWINMWQSEFKRLFANKKEPPSVESLPEWCYRYLLHRFHMYDRTGDGAVDSEEFEYVVSHFGVPAPDARKAFLLFSKVIPHCYGHASRALQNGDRRIDFPAFCELATEYYFSNDPAALGNFITGKLSFESADRSTTKSTE